MVTVIEYQLAEREFTVREQRRGFRVHAIVYAVAMALLVIGNLVAAAATDTGFLWFPFPLVAWGLGFLIHYLWGVRWGERAIRERQDAIARKAAQAE